MRGDTDQVDSQAAVEVREALLNFMRIKDMISGEKIEASNTLMGRLQHVNVDTEGFFVPTVNLGETVKSGDVIGQVEISPLFAENAEEFQQKISEDILFDNSIYFGP